MQIIRKRQKPRKHYVAECIDCGVIGKFSEEELKMTSKLPYNNHVYIIDCPECYSEMTMFVYDYSSKEGIKLMQEANNE